VNRVSNLFERRYFTSVIVCNIKSKLMLHLFQENKSYGIKTIALILCLHAAVHHVPNTWRQQSNISQSELFLCLAE
jgi:hypothetical protein